MRKLVFLCLLASAFLLNACAEPNPDAPTGGIHLLDGSYLAGSQHGPDAKKDLTACQACHGEAGGPGSNPLFNLGIDSAGGDGCESAGCHEPTFAHPQDWAGVNSTFHYSAGNIQDACTLCHGVGLDGGGGAIGTSCLGCHDSATELTLDCTACHNYPPDGTIHFGTISGVDHSAILTTTASKWHIECTNCHGMSESAAGGGFEPDTNYSLFDQTTDTNGDHWDGNIQMNSDVGYNSSTFGCAVFCHNNDDTQDPMSGSALPVELKSFGISIP